MKLFHEVCKRRPVVHVQHETNVNNAIQGALHLVLSFAAIAAFVFVASGYVPELMELTK